MNKNDFISKLQGVIEQGDDFQVLIYFALNTENGVCLKKQILNVMYCWI